MSEREHRLIPQARSWPEPRSTAIPNTSNLALNGGEPVRRAPFPAWPHYEQDELDAAQRVLASGRVNYWTGSECRRFEEEYAASAGCRYGIALMNGTVALELALRVLGIGPGDEVIVPARTFIASASCACAVGATPVVADIDPVTQNITAATISAVLSHRSKAIVAVHLAGWPCDMDPIMELASQQGLKVIEDCAQAHGAQYRGRPVGCIGHAGAFSFCQDKIISTGGEGGMLTLNDEQAYKAGWAYKDHGKSFELVHSTSHGEQGFRWLHETFGTNWRMTEFQAAIGRRQLTKLDAWVSARRRHAALLNRELAEVRGLRLTIPDADVRHAYYRFYAFLQPELLRPGWDKQRVLAAINAEGVPCYSGSCGEIYREKAFASLIDRSLRLPVARMLDDSGMCFRVDPALHESEIVDTACAVRKVLAAAISE